MDNASISPWFATFVGLLWFSSIFVWAQLIAKRFRAGEFLPYESRSPVPWGSFIALFTPLYVLLVMFASGGGEPPSQPAAKPNERDIYLTLWAIVASQTTITVIALFIIAASCPARLPDFGLSTTGKQLFRDIRIGVVAFLAAVAPIHGTMLLLLFLLGLREDAPTHPLVDLIEPGGPNIGLFLLASFVAVIVAPVSEEVLFRLMFQGWLEKREARRVIEDRASIKPQDVPELAPATVANDEFRMTNDEVPPTDDQPAVMNSSLDIRHSSFSALPRPGWAGLPFGWLPIVLSSALFAAAHAGHGPDPIPIFLLALILGYVYQRTHRIVPCIVAHMLFNSLAMLVLWQMIFVNGK